MTPSTPAPEREKPTVAFCMLYLGDRFLAGKDLWTKIDSSTARKHSSESIKLRLDGSGYIGDGICSFEPRDEVIFVPPDALYDLTRDHEREMGERDAKLKEMEALSYKDAEQIRASDHMIHEMTLEANEQFGKLGGMTLERDTLRTQIADLERKLAFVETERDGARSLREEWNRIAESLGVKLTHAESQLDAAHKQLWNASNQLITSQARCARLEAVLEQFGKDVCDRYDDATLYKRTQKALAEPPQDGLLDSLKKEDMQFRESILRWSAIHLATRNSILRFYDETVGKFFLSTLGGQP